jgi:hypothetical protein
MRLREALSKRMSDGVTSEMELLRNRVKYSYSKNKPK